MNVIKSWLLYKWQLQWKVFLSIICFGNVTHIEKIVTKHPLLYKVSTRRMIHFHFSVIMKEFVAITDRVNRCSSCFIRAVMGAKCSNIISYSLRKHTYFKTSLTVIFSIEHEQNFNMLTFLTSTGNIFLFVSVKPIFTSSGQAGTALLAKGQAAGVIKLIFERSCSNISQEPCFLQHCF